MARYTITISDSKSAVFLKFLKELGGAKVEPADTLEADVTIPKSHQKFVLDRIATSKPQNYLTLTEAKKRIKKAKKA